MLHPIYVDIINTPSPLSQKNPTVACRASVGLLDSLPSQSAHRGTEVLGSQEARTEKNLQKIHYSRTAQSSPGKPEAGRKSINVVRT